MILTIDLDDKLLTDIKKYFKRKTLNEVANLALVNYVKGFEVKNLNNRLNKKSEDKH